MGGIKKRRTLKLVNKNGDVLRINIIYKNASKVRLINQWRKLYGKRFDLLLIFETYKP